MRGNSLYQRATLSISEQVHQGQTIHLAMQQTQLFPPLTLQMVAIGEETGQLDSMLSKVAENYELDIENRLNEFNGLLEPIIMLVLAFLIGGLVIAMYLPIFQLSAVI